MVTQSTMKALVYSPQQGEPSPPSEALYLSKQPWGLSLSLLWVMVILSCFWRTFGCILSSRACLLQPCHSHLHTLISVSTTHQCDSSGLGNYSNLVICPIWQFSSPLFSYLSDTKKSILIYTPPMTPSLGDGPLPNFFLFLYVFQQQWHYF